MSSPNPLHRLATQHFDERYKRKQSESFLSQSEHSRQRTLRTQYLHLGVFLWKQYIILASYKDFCKLPIEKILKPQKHLLSIKHWLFYMTLGCFPGGCFFKITLMWSQNSFRQYIKSCSKCFLIVFTNNFEQAKRVWNEKGADKLTFHHKQFMMIFGRI